MATSGTAAAFAAAVEEAKSLKAVPQQSKLALYGQYKQATKGDAPATCPAGRFDVAGRLKYEAWAKLRGTGREEAERRYVDTVRECGGHGGGATQHAAAADAPTLAAGKASDSARAPADTQEATPVLDGIHHSAATSTGSSLAKTTGSTSTGGHRTHLPHRIYGALLAFGGLLFLLERAVGVDCAAAWAVLLFLLSFTLSSAPAC